MVRVLRVKPFGTQFGGSGPVEAAPGATSSARAGNTTMQQMALARLRVKAWAQIGRTNIGSKGDL